MGITLLNSLVPPPAAGGGGEVADYMGFFGTTPLIEQHAVLTTESFGKMHVAPATFVASVNLPSAVGADGKIIGIHCPYNRALSYRVDGWGSELVWPGGSTSPTFLIGGETLVVQARAGAWHVLSWARNPQRFSLHGGFGGTFASGSTQTLMGTPTEECDSHNIVLSASSITTITPLREAMWWWQGSICIQTTVGFTSIVVELFANGVLKSTLARVSPGAVGANPVSVPFSIYFFTYGWGHQVKITATTSDGAAWSVPSGTRMTRLEGVEVLNKK